MTLAQKREIVRRFAGGASVNDLPYEYWIDEGYIGGKAKDIEQVLRDYMNGKFKLAPKRKAKR